jgi:hypothetical protein
MKLSEFIKQYTDVIIDEYDDCDLNDLTEEQKEELMLLIHRIALKIIERLSDDDVAENHELINEE